ncbi:trans-1,2-dihydrobenzene-1,2-diol dehydrogenase [Octodon degus]|uniref:Trans-1,2-dihydrobenzene-1,2-diol dehydrogenase n=1 Tax=Octodon degus TaxID=10160 RepID=A0A6P6DQR4_OCTDE|nr:trans-1,2-dihydrobenzene-1,2-diol dehydrogenase [Octodon degus]
MPCELEVYFRLSSLTLEVAYIGTQNTQHKAAVLLCLAAGKAVLCEKPMGVNASEVREMVAEARSRGLFLMESLVSISVYFPGVDDTVTVLLQYPGGIHGSFTCSMTSNLGNTASVSGTKGRAEVIPAWAPMELVVNGERKKFPGYLDSKKTYNFPYSENLVFEAMHVRECLRKGLRESPVIPLAESELLADILEEVRKIIGVTFPQDKR